MAAQKGRSILIKISDGASPATWTSIGGLRTKSATINNETVDITESDVAPWRTLLGDAGIRSMSISGSGVFKDDAAFNDCEDLVMSGDTQEFQMVFGNGDILQGYFQITSLEYAGDHNNEQSYSMTFESAGQFSLIRA